MGLACLGELLKARKRDPVGVAAWWDAFINGALVKDDANTHRCVVLGV